MALVPQPEEKKKEKGWGWGRTSITIEKKAEDERKEKKASKTMEDYGAAVIAQRQLRERLEALERVQWGLTDGAGNSVGPINFVKDCLQFSLGLARLGYVPMKAIRATAWLVSQWQEAIEAQMKGYDEEEVIEVVQGKLRSVFTKIAFISIGPNDVGPDVALMPYLAKPGYDRETQKIVD